VNLVVCSQGGRTARSCSSSLERAAFEHGLSRAGRSALAMQLKRMPNSALVSDACASALRAFSSAAQRGR
jgi:hypothetical protein